MRSLSVLFILGLILLGFTLTEDLSQTLISLKNNGPNFRKYASSSEPLCLRDQFSLESLKEEVRSLEDSLDTNRIIGEWRHLNLSELPTPRALFIKSFADLLGDKNTPQSFLECSDVPCMYNTIYGTPDGIAGYVHYIWYLRTGIYLSADNHIPNQQSKVPGQYNSKEFPVSAYLYDEDELFGFWRLGRMLKAPLTNLTSLKEIQRIPRGENFENTGPLTCGLAHSGGWILLTDKCLDVNRLSDSGSLYPLVLHEMAHHLDYEEGFRFNGDYYRSQWKDFLELSGFDLREFRQNGNLYRQWTLKPGTPSVSAYAQVSPAENFAELIAHYRVEGEETKKRVSSAQFDFVSGYYQNFSFSPLELSKEWVQGAGARLSKDILKGVMACETPECIDSHINTLVSNEMARIRSEEVDGCKALTHPLVGHSLPLSLEAEFRKSVETYQERFSQELREALLGSFEEEMNPEVAYEAFFECHKTGEPCYTEQVRKRKTSSEDDEVSEKITDAYLNFYPIQDVEKEISGFYRSLLSSRESVMRKKADEIWESCKALPASDKSSPLGNDYLIRDGYMVSSMYNCLNREFQSSLQRALDAVKLKEFAPRNIKEREFILEKMRPRFTGIIDEHLGRERVGETKIRDLFTKQHGDWLYNSMRSNRWWVPRLSSQTQREDACKLAALKLIGHEVLFHLKKDLYADLLNRTCVGIR